MKIDLKKEINTLNGTPFKADEKSTLTVGLVIAEALLNDQTISKIKGYSLSLKAYESKELDVDDADLTLIKKALQDCKSYAPHTTLIFGQVLTHLEK